MKSITQSDIARRLGVSQQTVGFALNNYRNSRMSLRPEKRQKILETAQQMGYVPHNAARRLARSRSDSRTTNFDQVGLVYFAVGDNDLDVSFLATMAGAEHELSRFHASLTFIRVTGPQDWMKVEWMMHSGGEDGWFLYGEVNDDVVDRLKPGKIPYVILGDHRCTQAVPAINVDHLTMGRLAVQRLASQGHRRIGFMGGSMRFVHQQRILQGFRAALKEFAVDEDERLIGHQTLWGGTPGRLTIEEKPEMVIQWLNSTGSMPTALFTPEVDWAVAVHRVLSQSQIRVPEDVSILACEPNSQAARNQKFTRIELPIAEIGRQGVFLLHRIVSEPNVEAGEIKITPTMIEGWSTCPPTGQVNPRAGRGTAV